MTDPDLSEFQKLSERDQRRPCKVASAIEQVDEGEPRQQLEAALAADPVEITNAAIGKWLAARGITVNCQAISTHRRDRCKCHV